MWHPSVMQTLVKTNVEWRNKVAPRELSFAIDIRYGPLLDLYLKCHNWSYSLGLLKRNARMKIRKSEDYSVYSPALCMWNERGRRERRQEGPGRWWPASCGGCPAVLPCPNREDVNSGRQAAHIQIRCQGIWDLRSSGIPTFRECQGSSQHNTRNI